MSSASSVPSDNAAGSVATTQSATATPIAGISLFGAPAQSVAPTPSPSSLFGTPRAPAPTATTSLFGSNTLGSAATSTQSSTATPIAGISLFGAPAPSQPAFGTPTASSPVATSSLFGSNTSGSTATSTQLVTSRSPPLFGSIKSTQLLIAPSKKTIKIVDDGDCDTLLEVSNGRTTIQYEVNSIFLTTHSVVFKKMLGRDSNFSEAAAVREAQTTGKPALITLEDDPNVMEFILYALHGKYSKVPRKLSLEHLTQAAIICDKYWLHGALSLISEHWISLGTEHSVVHPAEWLYISWIFGPESVFTSTSRDFILKSVYSSNGDKLVLDSEYSGRKPLLEETPQLIASSLRIRRSEYLAGVQKSLTDLQQRYSGQEVSIYGTIVVRCMAHKEYCDAMQMGIVCRFLAKHGSKKFQDYSISKLYSLIEKLPTDWVIPSDTRGFGSTSHASCSWIPAFITEHKQAMENIKGLTFAEFPSRKWC
ncbi:hypothetical protein BZA77DRAFT_323514 [Pyronema omphalodes]|nr:hypothetical protein BZA77DRAFT_323514 [Pyronema omphalodes]